MTIMNGLYKVSFKTHMGSGNGVIVLHDGVLQGGDSMMAYAGTYQNLAGQFTAILKIVKHSSLPNFFSVMGTDTATIEISGEFIESTMTGVGKSSQANGVTLSVKLDLIQSA